MSSAVHVVRVVVERGARNIVTIGMPGDLRRYHYRSDEADSSAVCLALERVIRDIARWEVPAGDGFTVRVDFVNERGEPLASPAPGLRPASGQGDLHANMQWLHDHGDQYAGQWVALRDGELVDSDRRRLELQDRIANHPMVREVTIIYVETPADEPGAAAFAEMEAVADADDG